MDIPDLDKLSKRARAFLARQDVRRAPAATCSREQLSTLLSAHGAPVLESALLFEEAWGGVVSAGLTLGAYAVLRGRDDEGTRADVERLARDALVPIAKGPHGWLAIDASGAIHDGARGTGRLADDMATFIEREALVDTVNASHRLSILLRPRLGAELANRLECAVVAEASDSVRTCFQADHLTILDGVDALRDRREEATTVFVKSIDVAGAALLAAATLPGAHAQLFANRLRGYEGRSLPPSDAPEAAAFHGGVQLPLLGADGIVRVRGAAPPFEIDQVGLADGRVRGWLRLEGGANERALATGYTKLDAASFEDERVRGLLRDATRPASLQCTREELRARLTALGLPVFEPVLGFQERFGGIVFDEGRAALGTYAVLSRGYPDIAVPLVDGRSVVCIGYAYPHLLAAADDGTFLVLEQNLDDDEAPLEVVATEPTAEGLLAAVSRLP